MSKIKVMTDSPADVPMQDIERLNIGLIPVTIHFGDETYRDYIDIYGLDFYKKLEESAVIPTTAQVTVIEFYEAFKQAAADGYDTILCFTLPPEASGTHQNANLAKNMMADTPVDIVIIPGSLAYIYGRLVVEAAQLAAEGRPKEEILQRVNQLRENCYVLFVVDTLKYLKKGGRINPTVAAVGEVLNIKPLLTVKGGLVSVVDKVRGSKKVNARMMELLEENGIARAKEVYIFDGAAGDRVEAVRQELKARFGITHAPAAMVGPVIGTHAGPGLVGVLFFTI